MGQAVSIPFSPLQMSSKEKLIYAFTSGDLFQNSAEYKVSTRLARCYENTHKNRRQNLNNNALELQPPQKAAMWLLNKYDMPHVCADITMPLSFPDSSPTTLGIDIAYLEKEHKACGILEIEVLDSPITLGVTLIDKDDKEQRTNKYINANNFKKSVLLCTSDHEKQLIKRSSDGTIDVSFYPMSMGGKIQVTQKKHSKLCFMKRQAPSNTHTMRIRYVYLHWDYKCLLTKHKPRYVPSLGLK